MAELPNSSAARCASGARTANGAEYHPVKHGVGILLGQPEDGATAADLDIVGMGAQTQDFQRAEFASASRFS